jgi:hypothetical protein
VHKGSPARPVAGVSPAKPPARSRVSDPRADVRELQRSLTRNGAHEGRLPSSRVVLLPQARCVCGSYCASTLLVARYPVFVSFVLEWVTERVVPMLGVGWAFAEFDTELMEAVSMIVDEEEELLEEHMEAITVRK